MLPLLFDRLTANVSEKHIELKRESLAWNGYSTVDRKLIDCELAHQAQPNWLLSYQKLVDSLERLEIKKAKLDIVIGNRYIKYLVIPPPSQYLKKNEYTAYVEYYFESVFGDSISKYSVALASSACSNPRLLAAIDKTFVTKLLGLDNQLKIKLKVCSIQPYLVTIVNYFSRFLRVKNYYFILLDGTKYFLCEIQSNQIIHLSVETLTSCAENKAITHLIGQLKLGVPIFDNELPVYYFHAKTGAYQIWMNEKKIKSGYIPESGFLKELKTL